MHKSGKSSQDNFPLFILRSCLQYKIVLCEKVVKIFNMLKIFTVNMVEHATMKPEIGPVWIKYPDFMLICTVCLIDI